MGDSEHVFIVNKTISYIFIWIYLQNGFKNLIHAYPKNRGLRIIYHLLRLEGKRALPSNVQKIIDRIEKNEATQKDNKHE